jgi:signal transduction histidine kinase
MGLLVLAMLLACRELGVWWSDALVWPAVLAAFGASIIWRVTQGGEEEAALEVSAAPPPAVVVERERRRRLTDAYRGGFGVALVLGAGILFLYAQGALNGAGGDVLLAAFVVVIALALILAPVWWRLARNLARERAERIRSQERADVAAHLHDSVLQTLALVQRRADDPRAVAALARRQERELRAWLYSDRPAAGTQSVVAALQAAAADVEDAHGVAIEVVAVGDAALDQRGEALVAASREAMLNAAKFAAEAGPVSVYAEVDDDRALVFVRDRGPGFDPAGVPADRRGVRDSILGRMERHGGRALITSAPGQGAEVELTMELGER